MKAFINVELFYKLILVFYLPKGDIQFIRVIENGFGMYVAILKCIP